MAAVVGLRSFPVIPPLAKFRVDYTPRSLGAIVVFGGSADGMFLLIVLTLYYLILCWAGRMPLCSVLCSSKNISLLYF